jgi:AcrR family transcriptional regulator
MVTLSRKKREIQEREVQILRLARPILLREGYQALSMERLASMMEYAKGTLYNHFPNKEEIVLALALESMELRFKLFEAAEKMDVVSRHQLLAIGAACEIYTQKYAEHFAIEEWIRNSTIWDKSSTRRQELIRQCESRCIGLVATIVRNAVSQGNLSLHEGMTAEEMIFGFWAINYGSQVLSATSPSLTDVGIVDAIKSIRRHCFTLLNGYGWAPRMTFEAHVALTEQFTQRLDAFSTQLISNELSI